MGGSLGAKIFVFFVCVCVCCFGGGWSEVLIKYTGKYVKIYFIIKITFFFFVILYLKSFLLKDCLIILYFDMLHWICCPRFLLKLLTVRLIFFVTGLFLDIRKLNLVSF